MPRKQRWNAWRAEADFPELWILIAEDVTEDYARQRARIGNRFRPNTRWIACPADATPRRFTPAQIDALVDECTEAPEAAG